MKLRINGKDIPEDKQGRKVKLYALLDHAEVERLLLAGKDAGAKVSEIARADRFKAARKK